MNNRQQLFVCLLYSSQIWHSDAPLYPPSVCKCQGNRILHSHFIVVFVSVRKEEEKKRKKLSHFLKSHISGTLEAISLQFGMWSTEVGGSVHSKNRLVLSRQHRATEVQKCVFVLPVNILTGVAPASWAARHTTMCLDTSCSGYTCTEFYLIYTLQNIQ